MPDIPVPIAREYPVRMVNELVQNTFKFSEAETAVSVKLSETFNAVARHNGSRK